MPRHVVADRIPPPDKERPTTVRDISSLCFWSAAVSCPKAPKSRSAWARLPPRRTVTYANSSLRTGSNWTRSSEGAPCRDWLRQNLNSEHIIEPPTCPGELERFEV